MPHDVFISHSSIDKAAADTVCALLEADGIRCWIAPRDVQAGVSYAGSIIDAINASKAMVLIFSGAANASPQIEREIERAANHRLPILPFRIENVAPEKGLEYFLSTPHWLDAFTPPLDAHVRDLAKQLKALLGKTEVVGPRPADAAVAVAPAAVTAAAAPVSLPAAKKTPSRGLIAAAVVVGVGGVAAAATGTIWWTGQHHAAAPVSAAAPAPTATAASSGSGSASVSTATSASLAASDLSSAAPTSTATHAAAAHAPVAHPHTVAATPRVMAGNRVGVRRPLPPGRRLRHGVG